LLSRGGWEPRRVRPARAESKGRVRAQRVRALQCLSSVLRARRESMQRIDQARWPALLRAGAAGAGRGMVRESREPHPHRAGRVHWVIGEPGTACEAYADGSFSIAAVLCTVRLTRAAPVLTFVPPVAAGRARASSECLRVLAGSISNGSQARARAAERVARARSASCQTCDGPPERSGEGARGGGLWRAVCVVRDRVFASAMCYTSNGIETLFFEDLIEHFSIPKFRPRAAPLSREPLAELLASCVASENDSNLLKMRIRPHLLCVSTYTVDPSHQTTTNMRPKHTFWDHPKSLAHANKGLSELPHGLGPAHGHRRPPYRAPSSPQHCWCGPCRLGAARPPWGRHVRVGTRPSSRPARARTKALWALCARTRAWRLHRRRSSRQAAQRPPQHHF
jgi:hypothetical protein